MSQESKLAVWTAAVDKNIRQLRERQDLTQEQLYHRVVSVLPLAETDRALVLAGLSPPSFAVATDALAAAAMAAETAAAAQAQAAQAELAAQAGQLEQLQQQVDRLHAGQEIMLTVLDYDDNNVTVVSVPGFKDALVAAYSKRLDSAVGQLLFCMLTHVYLPKKLVIGAHLWKRVWAPFNHHLGIDNIHSLKNGLLLCKPLQWAFDNSKLSIVPDTTFHPPSFQAYLQDFSLYHVPLMAKLRELCEEGRIQASEAELEYMEQHLGNMTFGDVHARILLSDPAAGGTEPKPWTRVLNFQYKRSLLKASQLQWQRSPDPPPTSHSSPGAWNVQRLLDSII